MAERKRSSRVIILIGLFKLAKAALLIGLAVGAHHLLHRDMQQAVENFTRKIQVDPDNRIVHAILARVAHLDERRLRAISLGTFVYGALFAVEGVGLLMRKRWAEYLTVITTALLLPLEIYEIIHRVTAMKIAVLIGNVFIVVYLIAQLRKKPPDGEATPAAP